MSKYIMQMEAIWVGKFSTLSQLIALWMFIRREVQIQTVSEEKNGFCFHQSDRK